MNTEIHHAIFQTVVRKIRVVFALTHHFSEQHLHNNHPFLFSALFKNNSILLLIKYIQILELTRFKLSKQHIFYIFIIKKKVF